MNSIQIYQNPYVDVFAAFKLTEWKMACKEGEVTVEFDKSLGKNVVQITGQTSQANFLQLPAQKNLPKASLGLTGKVMYLVIKACPQKQFAAHFDYIVNDSRPVRLSVSNLYKEIKNVSGTSLQVPIEKLSSERWSVISLHVQQLFEDNGIYTSTDQKKFYLRGFTICASVNVKGIYTSDKDFHSHIPAADKVSKDLKLDGKPVTWQQKWKGVDIWNEDSKLALKVPADKDWPQLYKWVKIPARENAADKIQMRTGDPQKKPARGQSAKGKEKPGKSVQWGTNNQDEPPSAANDQNQDGTNIDLKDHDVEKKMREHEEEMQKQRELMEKQSEEIRVAQAVFAERALKEVEQIKQEYDFNLESKHIKAEQQVTLLQAENFYDPNKSQRRNCENFVLKPDPILALDRILGVHPLHNSNNVFFNQDPKMSSELLYTQANCVVGFHNKLQKQRLLLSKEVGEITNFAVTKGYCVTVSRQENGKIERRSGAPETELLLAVWCLETSKVVKTLKPPLQRMTNIDISTDQVALAVSGKDIQGRELILIYSFQDLVKFKKIELLGRQQADFQLTSLKFLQGINNMLIGVGKSFDADPEKKDKYYEACSFIRIFKVKNNYLPSQMITLNQTAKNTYFNNSCAGQNSFRDSKGQSKLNTFYVTTTCGLVYVINVHSRQVEKVLQLHDCEITSIFNTPKFIFTASKAGSLKIWAPDFQRLVSEIAVNQEIKACDVNAEGTEIAVLSTDGTLSQLELDSSTFKVIMRSHQDDIVEIAHNRLSGQLVSIGNDSSIKVWDAECLCQNHEFNTSKSDPPTKIATSFHDDTVCVGFKSGFLRIFNLCGEEKQILSEIMVFESAVMDIAFTKQPKFLASFYKNAKICIFNVEQGCLNPVKNIDYEFPNSENFSLAFSDDGVYLANISSNANIITVWETRTFSLRWYIDLTGDTLRKLMFAPNGCDLLALTTSSKLKYLRINPNVPEVETVREQFSMTELTPTDFLVTPNNKYILCAGEDGHIKVYDYFMRGQNVAAQQAFIGHLKYAQAMCLQEDMRFLYTVGPGNGIYRWSFFGDHEMPQDLTVLYEKTIAEIKREEAKEDQTVTLPTFKEKELKAYTEEQIAKLRKDILEGRTDSEFAAINQIQVPRPNKELVEDGGISLKRRPQIEYTPAGYTFEKHTIELQKVLGCSIRPQCGQNLVWDQKNRNFCYTLQNKLVFEELNATKDQMLKQEFYDPIHGLELSNDGKLILAYTRSGALNGHPQIIVWDTIKRRKVSSITIEEPECKAVKFSNYSNMLLVASWDPIGQKSTICVWDFLDNRNDQLCKSVVPYEILDVRWNPYLASRTDEFVTISKNIYHYWTISQSLSLFIQPGEMAPQVKGQITCLSFVEPMLEQCSVYMLLGFSNGEIWVMDTRKKNFLYSVKLLDCAVHKIVSSVSRIVVEPDDDRTILAWELKKTINDFDYDASNPEYFFAGNPKKLSLDGCPSASFYDETAAEALFISNNNSIWLVNFIEELTVRLKSCHKPSTSLNAVDFKYVSPNEYQCDTEKDQNYTFDQNYLVGSTGTDGVIKVWSMYDLEHSLNFMVPMEQCHAVAMHQFKPFMIASFADGFIRFFDLNSAKNLGRCKISSAEEHDDKTVDKVIAIRILPSGEHILCSTEQGQIFLIYVESWAPLSISIQNLQSLSIPVNGFDVSFLEPYNKWLVAGKHGKVVVYNRQDCNSFKQELFDKHQPPVFIFMDSFNVEEYVDNCFTEAKRVNTLDHYYGIAQRQLVDNQDIPENYAEAQFLNNDLASYICFVRKCNSLLIRNFELHQIVKKIDLSCRIQHMEMAPGSAPYVHLITETNDIMMIDFVNDSNRNEVHTMHEQVKTLKVCPNGRYLLTAGIKGDIALWSVRRVRADI